MRVAMLVGSYPPEICGVGDYTCNLTRSLKDMGLNVELLVERRWNEGDLFKILHGIRRRSWGILHIQYPSVGFGASLGPQAISLVKPSVVTLHEFSRVRLLRRAAMIPLCLRSYVVFTSDFEQQKAASRIPALRHRSEVIPIGSNISTYSGAPRRNMGDIVYFGLIVPGKGLEDLLQLASIIKSRDLALRVRIIGARVMRVSKWRDYAEALQRRSASLPVDWILDRPAEEISCLLAEAGVGYLPFPDGASERRGSLKAMLAAGVPCITRQGDQLTPALRKAVAVCESPEDALKQALDWIQNRQAWRDLSQAALHFAESYEWISIARRHIEMYQRLLGSPGANLGENGKPGLVR